MLIALAFQQSSVQGDGVPMDISKIDEDIEFIRKVSQLEEHDRVVKMCKHLISQLSSKKFEDRSVVGRLVSLRYLLIGSLQFICDRDGTEDEHYDELRQQQFILVDELVQQRKPYDAIILLEEIGESYDDDDESAKLLSKIVNTFSTELDKGVVRQVCSAFERILTKFDEEEDDDAYSDYFFKYIDYLTQKYVPVEYGIQFLNQSNKQPQSKDGLRQLMQGAAALVAAKKEAVGLQLHRLLANDHFYFSEYEDAIRYYIELVLYDDESDEQLDYLLRISEGLIALNRAENARMFLNEIILRASDNRDDERVERAYELLED